MADLMRLGIDLDSERASSALLGTPSICPSIKTPAAISLRARFAAPLASMLTPAHPGAPSHSLTGFFRVQSLAFFIIVTYRKHERRQCPGPLWPRARCLCARPHVSGH